VTAYTIDSRWCMIHAGHYINFTRLKSNSQTTPLLSWEMENLPFMLPIYCMGKLLIVQEAREMVMKNVNIPTATCYSYAEITVNPCLNRSTTVTNRVECGMHADIAGNLSAVEVAQHPWWKPSANLRLLCCSVHPHACGRRVITAENKTQTRSAVTSP
jgi:hypothetical protein